MTEKKLNLRNDLPYTLKPGKPRLLDLPAQRMLTVAIEGDPNTESAHVLVPLYAAAYAVRKENVAGGVVFTVEKLRGRWSDANVGKPKDAWVGTYALPVPEDTASVPRLPPAKLPADVTIHLERWDYGPVIVAAHVGGFDTEGETINALLGYARDQGREILQGSHEEIYLTDPRKTEEARRKTLILYRLQPDGRRRSAK